jgi:hypothetical protein
MKTRPLGPHELYWRCRIRGANAYRAGGLIHPCPYGADREFSGRAWRDGWLAAAQAVGVTLPHEMAAW